MPNVLIVDDYSALAARCQSAFQQRGYHVFRATDNCAALRTVLQEKIDIIIAASLMQGMSSNDFCESVRFAAAEVFTPTIPVVLLGDDQVLTPEAREDAHFVHPTDPEDVLSAVNDLLSHRLS